MSLGYSFPDLFASAEARAARDRGIARVSSTSSDFIAAGLGIIATLRGEYTGEEIRLHLLSIGIVPPHPNAMGSLVRIAAKRRLIQATGRYEQMKTEKSHARETKIWAALGGAA